MLGPPVFSRRSTQCPAFTRRSANARFLRRVSSRPRGRSTHHRRVRFSHRRQRRQPTTTQASSTSHSTYDSYINEHFLSGDCSPHSPFFSPTLPIASFLSEIDVLKHYHSLRDIASSFQVPTATFFEQPHSNVSSSFLTEAHLLATAFPTNTSRRNVGFSMLLSQNPQATSLSYQRHGSPISVRQEVYSTSN